MKEYFDSGGAVKPKPKENPKAQLSQAEQDRIEEERQINLFFDYLEDIVLNENPEDELDKSNPHLLERTQTQPFRLRKSRYIIILRF